MLNGQESCPFLKYYFANILMYYSQCRFTTKQNPLQSNLVLLVLFHFNELKRKAHFT